MLLANVESILNKFGVEPQLNLFLAKKTVCIVENWEVDAGGGGHGGGEGGGEGRAQEQDKGGIHQAGEAQAAQVCGEEDDLENKKMKKKKKKVYVGVILVT